MVNGVDNGLVQLRAKVCRPVEGETHINVRELYTISEPELLDKQMIVSKSIYNVQCVLIRSLPRSLLYPIQLLSYSAADSS